MQEAENYIKAKKMVLEKMSSLQGIKDICSVLFKNDKLEPMQVTEYQALIIKRIFFKYPKKVICTASTRAGKSLALGLGIVLLAVFRDGEKIRVIAPTEKHTKIVMGYVIQHVLDNELFKNRLMFDFKGMGVERLKKELSKEKLTFQGNSEVMSITANLTGKGRSLMGWGGTFTAVDEGEEIPIDIMENKVMRMLGDSIDSSIFVIGNPSYYGFMFKYHTAPDWSFMKIDWRECVKEGRLTESFVKDMENSLDSNNFRILYEADWPEELEDQLFSKEDLINLFSPLTEKEKLQLKTKPDRIVLGCDVARFGKDLSVLCKRLTYGNKHYLVKFKSFRKKDLMSTTGEIVSWNLKENFYFINVDDTGLGGGVTDRLKELPETKSKVKAFIAGSKPWDSVELRRKLRRNEVDENRMFLNKKALWHRRFQMLARKNLVKVIDENNKSILHDQLKKLRHEKMSNGKMKVIDPEDKSPDFADSAMISLWQPFELSFSFA